MKTIIEKIWDSHVIEHKDGFPDIIAIDLQLLHEVTSPQAFHILKEEKSPCFRPAANIGHCRSQCAHKKSGINHSKSRFASSN